ncbi:MAG: hypothetical protein L0Z62_14895 [Gemmataceae bacterium]|nr:hypothetical protein [Gemmataceae bacterium]
MRKTPLTVGEPALWFVARGTANPQFHFDTIAGRYVVLCFFQSAGLPASQQILAMKVLVQSAGAQLNDVPKTSRRRGFQDLVRDPLVVRPKGLRVATFQDFPEDPVNWKAAKVGP